jgi:glycosyltransferase involved in cell wall biosynthesis
MLISLIVPCYNEEQVLPLFKKETDKTVKVLKEKYHLDTEYVFVNDGSSDKTLSIFRQFRENDKSVRYISFSRNFGKESGLYAGLQNAKGDYVAVMDADLQDPPTMLPEMLDAVMSGEYDCAAARRATREGEPKVRSWFAKKFYKIINRSSDTEIVDGARDFRVMNRQMVNAVLELAEYNRFSKGIFSWVGFRTKWFSYKNVERAAGQTKWHFWSLFQYAIDGMVGYTTKPLEYAAWVGFLFCFLSTIGIIFIIIRRLCFGDPVAGWASTVVIILFCSGIQLLCTGIIGVYLSKTYLEVKRRPIYIVQETEETYENKKIEK